MTEDRSRGQWDQVKGKVEEDIGDAKESMRGDYDHGR
jgi:uncharacterized protein YjbJ (UPF0337 family)